MRNAGLEEAQAGIKITGRNINYLRYAEDTILSYTSHPLMIKNTFYSVTQSSITFSFDLHFNS